MTIRKRWLVLTGAVCLAVSLAEVVLAAQQVSPTVQELVRTADKSQYQPGVGFSNPVKSAQSGVSASPMSENATTAPMAQPDITVNPKALNFGSVTVGSTRESPLIRVRNEGSDSLAVGNITIRGPDAADFSKKNDNATLQIIYPGSYESLWVVFKPSSAGAKSATLLVPSNDPLEPLALVRLRGLASAAPQVSPPVPAATPIPEPEPVPDWALITGIIIGGAASLFVIFLLLKMET